jgi:hypothetical protein
MTISRVLILWCVAGPAYALPIIQCPGSAQCTGVELVVGLGQTVEEVEIQLKHQHSTVRLSGGTLRNVLIRPAVSNHNNHCVTVDGDHASLQTVEIRATCGRDGVHVENVSGFTFWSGRVLGANWSGIVLQNAPEAEIIGVTVQAAQLHGLALFNSPHAQLIGARIFSGKTADNIFVDAESVGTQIFWSRSRNQGGELRVQTPHTVTHSTVCQDAEEYTGCWSQFGSGNGLQEYGNPADFVPRWRTACSAPSSPNGDCDYLTPQEALAASGPGDRVVTGPITGGWGDIIISQPDTMFVCTTGAAQGTYPQSECAIGNLVVTAPGVIVIGATIQGTVTIQPDTMLVN